MQRLLDQAIVGAERARVAEEGMFGEGAEDGTRGPDGTTEGWPASMRAASVRAVRSPGLLEGVFGDGAEHGTRGRVRSPSHLEGGGFIGAWNGKGETIPGEGWNATGTDDPE